MLIVPADLPNMPQQIIERDVSIFLASSKKNSKPAKDSAQAKQEKVIREYILGECQYARSWAINQYGGNARTSSAKNLGIQREITNYLISLNHPVAFQILDEYKTQWKKGIY